MSADGMPLARRVQCATELQLHGSIATGCKDAGAALMVSAIVATDHGPMRGQLILTRGQARRLMRQMGFALKQGDRYRSWAEAKELADEGEA